MTSLSSTKRDIQRLQRAIVDGLEDVKGQDISVFNTEHLSPLFERVVLASGTSNRQTRALAQSIMDAVRAAGFSKPRIEGEKNGEWIIVDCGAAVAHVMQPAIRQYYQLEEIWGDKPVRLKFGAPRPQEPVAAPVATVAAKPGKPARALAKEGAQSRPKKAARFGARGSTSRRAGASPPRQAAPERGRTGSVAVSSRVAARPTASSRVVSKRRPAPRKP